jgi:cytochrome c oxidase assembly factor CtaG
MVAAEVDAHGGIIPQEQTGPRLSTWDDGSVIGALDRPSPSSVVTQWTPQPLVIALIVVLAVAYVRALRRIGHPWPAWRTALFSAGLLVLLWTSCGFLQVYGGSLYWAWTTQTLLLWLVIPVLVLSGHPLQLLRTVAGQGSLIDRLLRSRFTRVVGNPLIGPALVPVLSFALFFGPLPAATIEWRPVGWLVQLALLVVGGAMVVPLVGLDEEATSLAVGLSLAIGTFELVLDALPGIIVRLHNGLVTSWFDHRARHPWTPDALHDQRVAGAVLWCIAEIIDLPFLVLVYRRWIRADARDAARVDAVLEAERAARSALAGEGDEAGEARGGEVERDAPWWLTDPAMQDRFPRRE